MKHQSPMKITWFLLLLVFPAAPQAVAQTADSTQSDSAMAAQQDSTVNRGVDYETIRGIERDEKKASNTTRRVANTIFFLPRVLIDTILRTAGFGAVFIDQKQIIKKFKDIFYTYDGRIGWYPIINIISGSSNGYGLGVFYKHGYTAGSLKGVYGNKNIWIVKGDFSHIFFKWRNFWRFNFSGRFEKDDDFFFHGLGPEPLTDSRSHFRPETDQTFGIYAQRRAQFKADLGVRTSPDWEFFFTTFYQNRNIEDPAGENPANFTNVFDVDRLPGFNTNIKKWYTEISARFDNRETLTKIGPGARLEGYMGFSRGLNDDNERLFRTGIDAALFYPILRRNRILIPRVILDHVNDLSGRTEISFHEYPRHVEFRAVRSKELLRNDFYTLQTSLEYLWPLTYHLNAHLFYERVTVAKQLSKFSYSSAPWAVGFGMDIHTQYTEIGRFYVTYGSEGWFFRFTAGFSLINSDRGDWK